MHHFICSKEKLVTLKKYYCQEEVISSVSQLQLWQAFMQAGTILQTRQLTLTVNTKYYYVHKTTKKLSNKAKTNYAKSINYVRTKCTHTE